MDTGEECVRYICQRRLEYDSCGELLDRRIGHMSSKLLQYCIELTHSLGLLRSRETRLDDVDSWEWSRRSPLSTRKPYASSRMKPSGEISTQWVCKAGRQWASVKLG